MKSLYNFSEMLLMMAFRKNTLRTDLIIRLDVRWCGWSPIRELGDILSR